MSCPFSAIVVTAPNDCSAAASRDELRIAFSRVCPGVDPGSVCLLAVADPNGARIGSGGGTINALDAAARALTAARRTVLSAASGSSAKGFNDGDEEEEYVSTNWLFAETGTDVDMSQDNEANQNPGYETKEVEVQTNLEVEPNDYTGWLPQVYSRCQRLCLKVCMCCALDK